MRLLYIKVKMKKRKKEAKSAKNKLFNQFYGDSIQDNIQIKQKGGQIENNYFYEYVCDIYGGKDIAKNYYKRIDEMQKEKEEAFDREIKRQKEIDAGWNTIFFIGFIIFIVWLISLYI